MVHIVKIHSSKTPQRIHYIAEWAETRGIKQAEIARGIGADKGTVSRWFGGALPEQPYLLKIAAMFEMEEPNELFRDPQDTWMKRLFDRNKAFTAILEKRTDEEIARIHQMLEYPF